MKKVVFDKKKYKSYKDFYEDFYKQANGAAFLDWAKYPNLNYNASFLYEFLWYFNTDGPHHYVFQNFDKEKILQQKTVDDCEFGYVIQIFERFVKDHPNNKLEFENE